MAKGSIAAVAYYRMSTDRQEASIPTQREAVEKMARTKGYTIVREYLDEGISGDDTERRTGFRKMLGDVAGGDFDCVLCWDQSRFGRFDPLEAGYWVKPLRDAGVWLETVAEGRIDWSDFAGRIVYSVQQEGKHAFLKDMSRAVARGMLAKAKRGEWLGGKAPYGYVLNAAKRLEPGDAADVETVRWLYREYLGRDVGLAGLAEELNDRGVPSPSRRESGARWAATTIRNILTRPAYVGDTAWNRRHSGAYHGIRGGEIATTAKPKRGVRENTRAEWVVFADTHQPLVDRATFDRVRQKMTARRDGCSSPSKSGEFLFTGLLRCGRCGWPLWGQTQRIANDSTRRYRRYICGQYLQYRRHGCNSNHVQERAVLDVVLATLETVFLAPENLATLRAEIERQEREERAGAEPAAAALDRQISALAKKIETGTERWLTAPPSLVAEAGAKLEQWRKEREALEERRRSVAKPADSGPALDVVAATIAAGVSTLRKRASKAKPSELRAVLREMLEKVEIDFREESFGRKRSRGVPVGGRLYLRGGVVFSADLCRSARRSAQVCTDSTASDSLSRALVVPFQFPRPRWQDKRDEVRRVTAEHPEYTVVRVAAECGVHPSVVVTVRRTLRGRPPRRKPAYRPQPRRRSA